MVRECHFAFHCMYCLIFPINSCNTRKLNPAAIMTASVKYSFVVNGCAMTQNTCTKRMPTRTNGLNTANSSIDRILVNLHFPLKEPPWFPKYWILSARTCIAQYGPRRPSFFKRGYIVIKLIFKAYTLDVLLDGYMRMDIGISGIRMDFSWTWYENRKKANDVFIRHKMKVSLDGLVTSMIKLGKEATIVAIAHIFAKWAPVIYFFHLNTTEETHLDSR